MHQACEPVLYVWTAYRNRFGIASTIAIFLIESHAIQYCAHRNQVGLTSDSEWLYYRSDTVYSYVHEREVCHRRCDKDK